MKLFTLVAATALLATPALAADAVAYNEPAPIAVADTFSWTGGYVGIQAGYAWAKSRLTNEDDEYAKFDPNSFMGGVYLGYNYQLQSSPLVLGIEADATFGRKKTGHDFYWDQSDTAPDPDHATVAHIKYSAALRARLGYAMDRWLPYVAGGVSTTKLRTDLDHDGTGDWDFRYNTRMTGWNIGAGVEYAATDNLLIRAEYRYTDFGSKTFDTSWAGSTRVTLKTHDIRLGVAYKF